MKTLVIFLSCLIAWPLWAPQSPDIIPRFNRFVRAWKASWYGPGFAGRFMASGIIFDPGLPSVAHKTLAFGTILRIWRGGLWVDAIVLDRGPYIKGRNLDLSEWCAAQLGLLQNGVGGVIVEILGCEPRSRWRDALSELQTQ